MNVRTQNITLSALFIALGILLPILFHAAGVGEFTLPMFWPVIVGAFFVSTPYAFAVGALTPVLSMLVTGMPPVPTLYKMMFELAALGGVTAFLYRRTTLGTFWLLLAGLIAAEVAALLGSAGIALLVDLPPEFYAIASLLKIVPGLIALLIVMPVLIQRIKHEPICRFRKKDVKSP